MINLVMNSGISAYVVIFMTLIALLLLIIQLLVRIKILFIISSIVAFLPIIAGYAGMVFAKIQTDAAVQFIENEADKIMILKQSVIVANSSFTLGLYCSIPVFVLLVINIFVVKRK